MNDPNATPSPGDPAPRSSGRLADRLRRARDWTRQRFRESGPFWQAMRRLGVRLLGLGFMFLFLFIVLVGTSGWYTSRSQFCNSCHIMEPYYESWAVSEHNGVPCIECHFAPGFGGKLRGKMLGLVQLTKYVTKGGPSAMIAEIPDASCLRVGCHETRLLSGRVDFHGIPFDHRPHLENPRRQVPLRCTSCHSQIVQGPHMVVTPSTCFLCHFKGEPFNASLSSCLRCHAIPEKKYELGGGVTFTHELAYQRDVDCINCHRDVIRGQGEVDPERCRACHNRPGDLARFGDTVFLHERHVGEHQLDCLRCHRPIEHSLETEKLVHAASQCAVCHPQHHRDEIEMFMGAGAKTGPQEVGSMMVARVDCFACHRDRTESPSGAVVLKGTLDACRICHAASAVDQFGTYQKALQSALPEIAAAIDRARGALASANLPEARASEIRQRLQALSSDVQFVEQGDSIHNIHYASALVRRLLDQVAAICKELNVAPPKASLPAPPAALSQ